MAVKQTSIAALNQLVLEGKCKLQRERIYEYLCYSNGSRREIATDLRMELSAVCGRVNQLLKDGAIKVEGTRSCLITGKQVEVLTAKQPEGDY